MWFLKIHINEETFSQDYWTLLYKSCFILLRRQFKSGMYIVWNILQLDCKMSAGVTSCPKPGKSKQCEEIIPKRVLATLRSCILFTPFFLLQEMWRNHLGRKASVSSSIKTSSYVTFIMTLLHHLCYSMKLRMGEQEWASGLVKAAFPTLQTCTATRCERAVGYPC